MGKADPKKNDKLRSLPLATQPQGAPEEVAQDANLGRIMELPGIEARHFRLALCCVHRPLR